MNESRRGVDLDVETADLDTRAGRRYVSYTYLADACKRVDEDGT